MDRNLVFTTLFDKSYLTRGIALYRSLHSRCKSIFSLYVLAVDEYTEGFFSSHQDEFPEVFIITISDLLSFYPVLREIKKERKYREYCWTLSSFCSQYVLKRFNSDHVIYLDSDIYFFSDPGLLLEEMGERSILVTEHNFWPERGNAIEKSGKFCVQFVFFKNNEFGNKTLEDWRRLCEEECTDEIKGGVFGDQKYLDEWESLYSGSVYVSPKLGAGVAVWNLQRFNVKEENDNWTVEDKVTKVVEPLIFFHYSQFRQVDTDTWHTGSQFVSEDFRKLVYQRYADEIADIEKRYGLLNLPKKKYERVSITRFLPVPYLGEKTVRCEFEPIANEYISRMTVLSNDNKRLGAIEYRKSLSGGQWIIIDEIDDYKVLSTKWHEIIWNLFYHECYSGMKISDVYFEILSRSNKGELLMMECDDVKIGGGEIQYPCISKAQILRDSSSIASDKGAPIPLELVLYDSRIVKAK